ncbi:MAG: tRNA (adenosine(37)-N6)-threonylcarbamoyltransferase complex dimerization subunit type 1 TsaB [Formosimonas sp.]
MSTLLAIDTSNQFCSIALSHNGAVSELHQRAEQQQSAVVLPLVRQILDAAQIDVHDVDAFVVGIGPGGFTGVRLAVAVVQGLAFATDKPVVAVSSLLAMAYAAYNGAECTVSVAMDARMSEVYHATYRISAAGHEVLREPSLSSIGDFMAAQQPWLAHSNFGLVGNAVAAFVELRDWVAQQQVQVFAMDHDAPHARDLLTAARGQTAVAPDTIAPLYVRDKVAQTIAERAASKAAL